MTSILDQHEQASQVSQRPAQMSDQMTSSGYINMQLEDTTPLFSKQKMNFNPSDLITHVAVASDYLVLAMANGKLFRLDLKKPEQHEEIHYTKYVQPNTKLSQIFLDPLGYHLLMAFSAKNKDGNPELVYLHRNNSKLKSVTKSRNYEVTEVGWNYENNSTATTGPILLGTSQGHLLETEFEAENDKIFAASQQYWRQIFDIGQGKEKDSPITGIQFHRVSNTSKYFIFVTTPTRLYQFIGNAVVTDGKTSLQSIFHVYLTRPETSFQEIPSSLKYSKLQFFFDRNNTPKTFAWLTEPGIFYGQLDPTSQQNSNSLFTQNDLINYPSDRNDVKEVPLSFVLTEFHALLMYSDRVKAVSLLNQELVYEDHYSEVHGKLKNIIKDPIRKTIFAVTEKTIFRYKVTREERNVWRIYSDKEQFDLAKEYCNNNPAFIDMINVKQAEMLFSKGEYEKSAKVYAETLSSFETVCLKFLQCEKYAALKVYLEKRLEDLNDDKTLISMIVIWMTELYLSELGSLRRDGKQDTQEYHHLQSDFEVFLLQPKVVKCMQLIKSVIYNLMSSHGDKRNLIKLTVINEDYENVVAQNIYTKSYGEALNMLQSLKKPELFYEFAPSLMAEVPQQTVNALMSQGALLSPVKLLPAFLACDNDEKHVTEIIRYLEFMLQNFNVREKAIHNYLLTLYVDHDPQLLMRYLTRQQSQDIASVNYDVHYALRLCREKNLTEACVHLSALLGLWETATELALGVSLALAKDVARKPDDEGLQRTLWLSVAEHVITKNQDLREAMSLLEECQLIKIEDILPFFSDVVTIDHFRDPICQSLQEYNNQIEELKAEMEDATKSAEYVRQEIQSFRNRSVLVSAGDSCSLCALALLLRPFYLFPCSHRYHADCLRHHTQPLLPPARRNKLSELQRQLNVLSKIELDIVTSSGLPRRDQIKNEIDDIVAAECVFCGEYMIQSIDKPFIADEDWDRMMKEWE